MIVDIGSKHKIKKVIEGKKRMFVNTPLEKFNGRKTNFYHWVDVTPDDEKEYIKTGKWKVVKPTKANGGID